MRLKFVIGSFLTLSMGFATMSATAADSLVEYAGGGQGPGAGKRVVLISGDEEYRSEETMPQLGKILATRHGFDCTILFAINPDDGSVNPNQSDNIPGLDRLVTADLMVIFTRFRNLPDEQMRHIVDYVNSGRPIIGLRTATHAFNVPEGMTYRKWSFDDKDWDGGFGRQVLGETWVNHYGHHGHQSTRGLVVPSQADHPILRGIEDGDVWGPTDVYEVRLPLPDGCQPLLMGQVLTGMSPSDPPLDGPKNDPMMPVAWLNTYNAENGTGARVFTTTMGASQDFASAGLRRLLVNACYWAVGLDDAIPAESNVDLVGEFVPLPFGFGGFKKGVFPSDHAIR
jgi:type 1 glutamine amidotransferase